MESIGGTETNKGSRRRRANGEEHEVQGRKGADKQPAVIEVAKLKDDLPRLKKLKTTLDEASEDFNNAVTKTAEKSGLLSSVVRKIVTAAVGENFDEEKRKAEQLSLAFEEVGPQ